MAGMTLSKEEREWIQLIAAEAKPKKTAVEWIAVTLPALIVVSGMIFTFATLSERFSSSCTKFQADLTRIESSGTAVSLANRERIAGMESHLTSIDKTLARLEDGQTQMIGMLSGGHQAPRSPGSD